MLTPVEARVLDHLDVAGMVRFTSELVQIPSLGGRESPAQLRVAEWMEENGLEVDLWELDFPTLQAHPAFSAEIDRGEGLGLVGALGGGPSGPTLILNGHVDVVPPGDESAWTFAPWGGKIEGGRVLGRGALDMKGGLATGLFAAKAIVDAGVRLKGRLLLQSVIGEEDGGVGTLATVERGYRGDAGVIMEPTDLAICPAQAGALNFRITIRGKAAHGCVRDAGVSALEKYQLVHKELVALEVRRNHNWSDSLFRGYGIPFPISVGKIQGGDWASSVPDRVQVEGRFGLPPEEDVEEARQAFQEALDLVTAKDPWLCRHPPELEWWGGSFLPAKVPVDTPILTELSRSMQELGCCTPRLSGVTFGSDMRLLVREAGIPTVLCGPGDVRMAHSTDEAVEIEDLVLSARTLALTALRFCGYENV